MDNRTGTQQVREERRNKWREIVAQQAGSGKNVKAFCEEHGLKPWQFLYWRAALRPKPAEAGGFIAIPSSAAIPLIIEIGACRIKVERNFDSDLLRQVIAALSVP